MAAVDTVVDTAVVIFEAVVMAVGIFMAAAMAVGISVEPTSAAAGAT